MVTVFNQVLEALDNSDCLSIKQLTRKLGLPSHLIRRNIYYMMMSGLIDHKDFHGYRISEAGRKKCAEKKWAKLGLGKGFWE